MFNARIKNIGWRIDYFLVSERIKGLIQDALIYSDVMGSDHCPIGLRFYNSLNESRTIEAGFIILHCIQGADGIYGML